MTEMKWMLIHRPTNSNCTTWSTMPAHHDLSKDAADTLCANFTARGHHQEYATVSHEAGRWLAKAKAEGYDIVT
ncbi:MAG: hypothetical protein KBC38_00870 [Candidatus Pacebacteria bacterium]|nr:hypothetical protein [Candidatus Paceibacterota bacterium]MBP9840192.1 hypothetical protein [Candidatus Paceibacterota bacterium]